MGTALKEESFRKGGDYETKAAANRKLTAAGQGVLSGNDIGTGIRLMSICSCSHNASSESIANSSSEIVSRLTPGK